MKLLVYFMLILMVLRLLAEIKVAIECKCGSTVVPQDQAKENKSSMEEEIGNEGESKKKDKKKKKKKGKNENKKKGK